MKKKTIVSLLLSLMSAYMLSGCGSSTPPNDNMRVTLESGKNNETSETRNINQQNQNIVTNETSTSHETSSSEDETDMPDDLQSYTSIENNTTSESSPIPGDDFNHNSFEFDNKHIVFNDKGFTFGGTKYVNIYETCTALDYNFDGDRVLYTSGETVVLEHSMANFDTNITGGMCEFEVINKTNDEVYLNQCVLQRVTIKSDYTNGLSLADNGYTFNIGSNLTERSSYEDYENAFGKPDEVITRDELEVAIWDNALPVAHLEVAFMEGGRIAEITYSGDIY